MSKNQNGFTLKYAIKTFNHYGAERAAANRSAMNWMPSPETLDLLSDCEKLIDASTRTAKEMLNKDGYALFTSRMYQ